MAHAAVYELLVRPIVKGEVLHHLCFQEACVNPEHLEPMTRSEHMRLHALLRYRRSSGEES